MIKIGDIEIKRIGLGTNQLTDSADNHDFLRQGLAAGLNFIDTAHIYTDGDSERTIGNALAPFPDNVVIATKGGMQNSAGNNDEAFLRANLEQSLESLQTDCITLYQIHRLDPDAPIKDTMELMKTFQAEGKIKYVGLSEVSVEQLEEARQYIEITSVQNHFNLNTRQHEPVVDYCTQNGIIFIPYFPLRDMLHASLQSIADVHNATTQQIVLAWMLRRSPMMLPIPGTLSIEHLQSNLAALDIELSDDEYAHLNG